MCQRSLAVLCLVVLVAGTAARQVNYGWGREFTDQMQDPEVTVLYFPANMTAACVFGTRYEEIDFEYLALLKAFKREGYKAIIGDSADRPSYFHAGSSEDAPEDLQDSLMQARLIRIPPNQTHLTKYIFWDDMFPAKSSRMVMNGALPGPGALVIFDDIWVGDAACTNFDESFTMPSYVKWLESVSPNFNITRVDERTVLFSTGLIKIGDPPAFVNYINVRFMCTLGITQPLPLSPRRHGHWMGSASTLLSVAGLLAIVLAVAGMRALQRKAREIVVLPGETPAAAIARVARVQLDVLVGRGMFGKVYLGHWHGKKVAVKIMEFVFAEELMSKMVAQECQQMQACKHPSFVRFLLCLSATARYPALCRKAATTKGSQPPFRLPPPAEGKGPHEGSDDNWDSVPRGILRMPTSNGSNNRSPESSVGGVNNGGSDGNRSRGSAWVWLPSLASSSRSNSGDGSEGDVLTFMTLVVAQYIEGGTLWEGICVGRFRTSNGVDAAAVYATAHDIASGLEFLHLVIKTTHRDLSCNNVLLDLDTSDFRGFCARLTDFGLSKMIADSKTHCTSESKGTLDFMPPEVFGEGRVTYALDIYSLGIIIYAMWTGCTPYNGMPTWQVIGLKSQQDQRLTLPASMPLGCQELVWDCTHHDRVARPTASQVRDRLADLMGRL